MKAAVLTYPGHFFLTQLCVRSLVKWDLCECADITILYDDLDLSSWTDYPYDLSSTFPGIQIVPYSALPCIDKVRVGWWRQQLIKLHADQLLTGEEWLLVDGDVLFDHQINPQITPVYPYCDDDVSVMMANYVRNMLGIAQPYITVDDQPYLTSSIPWRLVDRDLLQSLRDHVQQRYPGDLVETHAGWFQDQTIVGGWPEPTRWIMSEWELIENYRYHVLNSGWPVTSIGGYDYEIETKYIGTPTFRHGFVKDQELGSAWFEQQSMIIDPQLWNKSRCWWENRRS